MSDFPAMWIKICANTNLEDAQMAASLGADAVGFVFAPSKRQVTVAQVAEMTPHLPADIEKIGVFPALDAGEIARAAREAGLSGVQLHGGLDLSLIERLHELLQDGAQIIQTIHWQVDADGASAVVVNQQLAEIAAQGIVKRVLVDSKVGTATGGTGVSFDWNAAQPVFLRPKDGVELIVAGGLRPENVRDAIAALHPWGVDVASGVEADPGRKSPERLATFIRNARESK